MARTLNITGSADANLPEHLELERVVHVLVEEGDRHDEHEDGEEDEEEAVEHVHHQPGHQEPSGAADTGHNLKRIHSSIIHHSVQFNYFQSWAIAAIFY